MSHKIMTALIVGITGTMPLSAAEISSPVFTPPGMPAMEHPGTVRILADETPTSNQSSYPPELRREMSAARLSVKTRGWVEISESSAQRVDSFFDRSEIRSRLRKPDEVRDHLAIEPTPLGATMLADADLLGSLPSGTFIDNGWSGVTRVLDSPMFGRVVLEESDYVAAGAQITLPQASVSGTSNSLPIVITAYRAPSGNGYTEFIWFTQRKQFTLLVGKYLAESDGLRKQVKELMGGLY